MGRMEHFICTSGMPFGRGSIARTEDLESGEFVSYLYGVPNLLLKTHRFSIIHFLTNVGKTSEVRESITRSDDGNSEKQEKKTFKYLSKIFYLHAESGSADNVF